MKASSGFLSRKRRREAAYQRGYEAGLVAATASCVPIAYLRYGEQTFVQNVPFGAMWISDKDDPRSFPVYDRPLRSAPSVAVIALEWTQFTDRSLDLNADSIEGAYVIRPSAGNQFPVYLWVPGAPYDDARLRPFNDVEAAKSAAQTHHEALVLSAISAQVQDVAGLLYETWNAAVEQASAIANDCVHLTPDPGAAIRTMLNGRTRLLPTAPAKQEDGQ